MVACVSLTFVSLFRLAVSAGTGEMKKRYGFVYVDRDNEGHGTMERRKKDSFAYYQNVIRTNGQEL